MVACCEHLPARGAVDMPSFGNAELIAGRGKDASASSFYGSGGHLCRQPGGRKHSKRGVGIQDAGGYSGVRKTCLLYMKVRFAQRI